MAIADFNYADFNQNAQAEQDKTLLVKFYLKSVQDTGKSQKANRPVFVEKEYIDIKTPGSRDGAARPASHADKERFIRHYEAFKARIELPLEGTPLSEWPLISRSMVEEMSFMNIKTVEQLADLNDAHAGKFMGAQTFKQKAKKWLADTESSVTNTELQSALAEQAETIAKLQAQLKEVMAAAPRKRKSRAKPKVMPPAEEDPTED